MSPTDTRIKTAKPAEKSYKIYDADGLQLRCRHQAANGGASSIGSTAKRSGSASGPIPRSDCGPHVIGATWRVGLSLKAKTRASRFVRDFRLCQKTSRVNFTAKPCRRLPKSGLPSSSIHGSRATPEQSESVWTSMSMMCSAVCPFRTLPAGHLEATLSRPTTRWRRRSAHSWLFTDFLVRRGYGAHQERSVP